MRIFLKSLAALLFLALSIWAIRSDSVEESSVLRAAEAAAEAAPIPGADGSWRRAAVWDDGKAEFCAYDVKWARYGGKYDGRALLILVKEPWNAELEVKADDPARAGFDVLKLNHVRDVPTGIYSYHQMASAYLHRGTGALRKLAATSSEACGVSTAEVAGGRLETRSYFDGQGDRSQDWPAGALPEDALPASLRDWVAAEKVPATLSVFPSLMHGRFPELKPADWRVERKPGDSRVEIRLSNGAAWQAYTFERAAPHRLVRLERNDGTTYELAKCDRLTYWEMNGPGQEAWLPESAR